MAKQVDVKVDGVGFNASHWAKKTEADFVKEEAHQAPASLPDEEKVIWLKKAYAACKQAVADAEKAETQKAQKEAAQNNGKPAAQPANG